MRIASYDSVYGGVTAEQFVGSDLSFSVGPEGAVTRAIARCVARLRNRVQMVVCRCGFKTFNLRAPPGIEGASKHPAGQPPIYDNAGISASNTGGQVEQFEWPQVEHFAWPSGPTRALAFASACSSRAMPFAVKRCMAYSSVITSSLA